jgi:cytochrome c553
MKRILLVTTVAIFTMGFAQADGAADWAVSGCASCHGTTGGTSIMPIYPKLAGQNAAYTVKQLKDFQTGVRQDPTMNAMAAIVAGKEQSIADFLANQQ